METKIITKTDFNKIYWRYFLILENDFLNTERYLTINKENSKAFSIEYLKLYLSICSEIDVVAKSFVNQIDDNAKAENIHEYASVILNKFPDIVKKECIAYDYDISIVPWKDWTFTISTNKHGETIVNGNVPDWWTKYNKLKHKRTTINSPTQKPYHEFANQENVLNALAGLYILEKKYLWYLALQRLSANKKDKIIVPNSKLFDTPLDVYEALGSLEYKISRLSDDGDCNPPD